MNYFTKRSSVVRFPFCNSRKLLQLRYHFVLGNDSKNVTIMNKSLTKREAELFQ